MTISKALPALLFSLLFIFSCKQKNTSEQKSASGKSITLIELPEPQKLDKDSVAAKLRMIEDWYNGTLKAGAFNGGLLVGWRGNIIFETYKGTNPLGGKDSINANTAFHIASVTKTFTAMSILKLMEEGKLNLDDSLSQYFPEFNYPGVTVRTLLNHRSGLPNYLYFTEKAGFDKVKFLTNREVMDFMIAHKAEMKNVARPDTRFSYSNTNYLLLALLIEKASGQSYPEFIKENIFIPFGMKNSFVYTSADSLKATPSYDGRGQFYPLNFQDGTYGDKNIYSTVQDLYRWDRALRNNLFLKKETLEEAYKPYSNEKPGIKNYGLGWRMDVFENGKKIIFHNGLWHGNNAVFMWLPAEDATIIALNNRFSKATYGSKWLANAFSEYFTAPPPPEEGSDSTSAPVPLAPDASKKSKR